VGIFDRIILALFTAASAAVALALVVMAAGGWLAPLHWLQDVLGVDNGRWAVGILAGLWLVVSLRFLAFGSRRDRPEQALIHDTAMGEVRIALSAVENLVIKAAKGIRGVRDVKAKVYKSEGSIGVRLRAVVSPEVNVPETSRAIQQAVTDYTKNVVGVDVTEVKVVVQNITNEARRSRVE